MHIRRIAKLVRTTLTDRSEAWSIALYLSHESNETEIECYSRQHAEQLLEALHANSNTEVHYTPELR